MPISDKQKQILAFPYTKKYQALICDGAVRCVDGDTLIYDPIKNTHIKAREFNGGHVYAYDRNKLIVAEATKAEKYSRVKMYDVTTKSGKKITVSAGHRFLTPFGWRDISELQCEHVRNDFQFPLGYKVLTCVFSPSFVGLHEDHPVTISDTCQSIQPLDAPNSLKIVQYCQDDYSVYSHPCDEQLQAELNSDKEHFPSKAYVPEHIQHYSQRDVQECVLADNRLCQSLNRPSKNVNQNRKNEDCACHCDNKATEYRNEYMFCECQLQNGQVCQQSLEPSYHQPLTSEQALNPLLNNECQTCESPPLRFGDMAYPSYTLLYEEIQEIKYKKTDYYYDLHVPVYENYLANGFINHNSGKTSIMTIAFVDWAMREFNNTNFAICGKTVGSAIKNIIVPYMGLTYHKDKYKVNFTRSDNKMVVRCGNRVNTFYIYGGKDESSYMLIQGITLGGVFLDEVALMARSFVEQALARCSMDGARYWFNCNPASPAHWFYTEWILEAEKHKALHLHFLMTDNPSLSDETLERYERTYSGIFHDRYVKGEWVIADGLVYPNFNAVRHIIETFPPEDKGYWWISLDYGIVNPFAAGLWHVVGNVAYCIDEYYHDSEGGRKQKTDEEHYAAIERLAGDRLIQHIVVDPSASSFKETIRRHGRYNLRNADNEVLAGIANCMTLLDTEYVKFSSKCKGLIKEFSLYSWDADSGKDEVIKENDHAEDGFRYFVQTILRKEFKHIPWGKD